MEIFHKIFFLVVFFPSIYALSCIPCDPALCVKPINCKRGLVKGVCGCCDVCAKIQGERCGGPWRIHGLCAKGLKCVSKTRMKNETGFLPKHFKAGICELDACKKKKCSFKEKCKINKSGRPMCICPRRCSKRRQPVCGLLNGKQYKNKCKLNREECFSKKAIAHLPGPCKKCTYQGQKYKFGDTRPDVNPCEICFCRHGIWTCEQNCSTNIIPKLTELGRRSCLMSSNGKNVVLPCPNGFSCRVPRSNDNIVRSGICKKKKVFKPKNVPRLLEIVHGFETLSVSRQEDVSEKTMKSTSTPTSEILRYSKVVRINSVNKSIHHVVSTVKPTMKELKEHQLKGGLLRHVCMASADAGTCSPATLTRWFYNASSQSCEQFQYGGCGGNFNNFLSKEKCEDICHSELYRQPWKPILTIQSFQLYTAPKLTEKSNEDVFLEMCHDIKTGMSYRDGEKWKIDECISCTCANGRDLCIAATCLASCSKPIHVKGKCCPICEPDLEHTESMDAKETECRDITTGMWYHSGESWNKDDCVHCICFEGETSCMTSVCAKPSCEQPIKKVGVCCHVCPDDDHQVPIPTKEIQPICVDSDRGKTHSPGEAWKVNDCISCFCDKSGLSTCHKLTCPKSKCDNLVHLQGRCCPVCPDSFRSACIYDNRMYFQGDFMVLTDMCTLCKCKGSTWNCTKKHCNKTVNGIDSSFNVKDNMVNNDEQNRNLTSDISVIPEEKLEYSIGKDDNDEFIIEDPNRMIRRDRRKPITSDEVNTNPFNTEQFLIFSNKKLPTPNPSSFKIETSADANENLDKTHERKSHLKSSPGDHRAIFPLSKEHKNRRWSSSWYQDVLHIPDPDSNNNNTVVYRTKRL